MLTKCYSYYLCVLFCCKLILAGNTFANWDNCGDGYDHMIATSKGNDDGNHPLHISSTTVVRSAMEAKILFHRPNKG